MQTKTERNLNEIFDVDPIPKESLVKDVPSEIIEVEDTPNYRPDFNPNAMEERENEELKTDMANDYDVARANYKSLIRQGEDILELVINTAHATEDPKHIDAASRMIGQLATLNSRLLELTQKKQDVYNKTRATEIIRNTMNGNGTEGKTLVQNNTVTNNVQFVGTSADLAKLIKEAKEQNEKTTDR